MRGPAARFATGGAMTLAGPTPTATAVALGGMVSRQPVSAALGRITLALTTRPAMWGNGSRTAGTIAIRWRQQMEGPGRRVIVVSAFFGAVPGSTIRGTSVRRTASGSSPVSGASAAVSALPGRCRKAAYLLTLKLFTAFGPSKRATSFGRIVRLFVLCLIEGVTCASYQFCPPQKFLHSRPMSVNGNKAYAYSKLVQNPSVARADGINGRDTPHLVPNSAQLDPIPTPNQPHITNNKPKKRLVREDLSC
jgi:hypothetical protein